MNFIKSLAVFLLTGISIPCLAPDESSKISVHVENKILNQGKTFTIEADMYYWSDIKKLITKYDAPRNLVYVYTSTGETKVYNTESNEVRVNQNPAMTSKHNLLYLFVNNNLQDMGLREAGYKLQETNYEDNYMISYWESGGESRLTLPKIKLVHENHIPIYTAYYNVKDQLVRKTYYSEYQYFKSFAMPLRVTDIDYLPNGDSLITRMRYMDVKTGMQAQSSYFYFEVPEDANLVE